MKIDKVLENVDDELLRSQLLAFLNNFLSPAFGSLPKREIELSVFELLRNIGAIKKDASIYSLMTDLKVTRSKASQLLFDLEIRQHGNNRETLDELVKEAIIQTRFVKDGDYFAMEIENPLTIAHLRQRLRDLGHFSDTSFNANIVKAPVGAVTDLMLTIIPSNKHSKIENALVQAGAPETGIKAIVKGALKTLGEKVVGEASDQLAESIVDRSPELIRSMFDASAAEIRRQWKQVLEITKD